MHLIEQSLEASADVSFCGNIEVVVTMLIEFAVKEGGETRFRRWV